MFTKIKDVFKNRVFYKGGIKVFLQKLKNWKVFYMHKKYDGKKVVLDYPPLYVTISVGGYCMNQCEFCCSHSVDSKNNPKSWHQYNIPYQMGYDDFCKIVDMCHYSGVPHVHIVAMGEPFLHRDILRMMDYLSSKYGELSIQTNFNKKLFERRNLIDEIVSRADKISSITTDLFSPNIHNKIKIGSNYSDVVDIMEKISKRANIFFRVHLVLTKITYKNMGDTMLELHKRGIRFQYNVVNLHPHNFNDFTSPKNCYYSNDRDITFELKKIKALGEKLGIRVNTPKPFDQMWKEYKGMCLNFWSRFQVLSSKYLPKDKWIGNVIPSQCNAVVMGKLYSLGNLFDYDNLMEFWNNEKLVKIRSDMINGKYPDPACRTCYKYHPRGGD